MPIQGIGNCIPIQTTETLHMKELMFDAYKSLKTLLFIRFISRRRKYWKNSPTRL